MIISQEVHHHVTLTFHCYEYPLYIYMSITKISRCFQLSTTDVYISYLAHAGCKERCPGCKLVKVESHVGKEAWGSYPNTDSLRQQRITTTIFIYVITTNSGVESSADCLVSFVKKKQPVVYRHAQSEAIY